MWRDRINFALVCLWIVAISLFLTILLSIPLFSLVVKGEHLTEVAQMSQQTLVHNFNSLMGYMLNPFQNKLAMPDFPSSSSGLKHFAEVKKLFMIDLLLSILLLPAIIRFRKQKLALFFRHGIRLMMIVPVILALFALMIGFDNFFIYFHQIIFRDNSWIFNPITDPIIDVLPEIYFMYAFIIFVILYQALFGVVYYQSVKLLKQSSKKDTK